MDNTSRLRITEAASKLVSYVNLEGDLITEVQVLSEGIHKICLEEYDSKVLSVLESFDLSKSEMLYVLSFVLNELTQRILIRNR